MDEDEDAFEHDALRVLAHEMAFGDRENWPDYLLLLGDQVYVDLGAPKTREFVRSRRDTDEEPEDEVVDYEEYARLYHESWNDPLLRWLFSTVSVGMIWDDHDMGDDWNISYAWVRRWRSWTGGRSAGGPGSSPTGSTSTSGTSRSRSSMRTRPGAPSARGARSPTCSTSWPTPPGPPVRASAGATPGTSAAPAWS